MTHYGVDACINQMFLNLHHLLDSNHLRGIIATHVTVLFAMNFMPFFLTLFVSLSGWLLVMKLTSISYFDLSKFRRYLRQTILVGVAFAAVVAVILSLPVSDQVRGQIVTLVGVITSGVFAFASSTVVANLMAGLMLRMNKAFNTGDFIQVGEHFGRVIELGVFESEIQSEQSTLIALPNTYLIANPIEVTTPDAAIVSAEVSLGYDVHHGRIEPLLLRAADTVDLHDTFTQVLSLGDFSVLYRVSGVLDDVKQLLTTRSNLHRAVLDELHDANIEIVSPTFVNQRPIGDVAPFIPVPLASQHKQSTKTAEDVVFRKADQAEQTERLVRRLHDTIAELKAALATADADEHADLTTLISLNQSRLDKLLATEAQ